MIPNDWKIKKMSDVVTWSSGGTPRATEAAYYDNGTIPWLVIGDLNDGIVKSSASKITELGLKNSSAKIIPSGTLLVAMYGSIGKLGITGMECCTNQAIAFAKELHGVTTKYMFYYLMMIKPKLISMGKGGTQKNISQAVLKSLQVIVPPTPEQDRIVARIEELFSQLDAGVSELNIAKERLKVYRQAVLNRAFEQCKEFRPLSTLGNLSRGKSKHRPRNDPALFEKGKYPFIQTGDVKAASKYISDYSKKYGEFGLQQSKLWPKGTLCITIAANIAETAFLEFDACFPDSVVGFTPGEDILPEYVRFFIESQKKRLRAFAPATAQKNINLDTLEKLTIPYCSLEEQQQIVREIDSKITICDSIKQTIDTALQQAGALRQSILKKAFEGETVPAKVSYDGMGLYCGLSL